MTPGLFFILCYLKLYYRDEAKHQEGSSHSLNEQKPAALYLHEFVVLLCNAGAFSHERRVYEQTQR